MIYKYALNQITLAIISSANLSDSLFITFTFYYLQLYYTKKFHRIQSALGLLISYCVLISGTNKCFQTKVQNFQKMLGEPQISRRHTVDMQQAASCEPTNITATLHNLEAHALCTPDLIYNNSSAPVCVCRLPPLVE